MYVESPSDLQDSPCVSDVLYRHYEHTDLIPEAMLYGAFRRELQDSVCLHEAFYIKLT